MAAAATGTPFQGRPLGKVINAAFGFGGSVLSPSRLLHWLGGTEIWMELARPLGPWESPFFWLRQIGSPCPYTSLL